MDLTAIAAIASAKAAGGVGEGQGRGAAHFPVICAIIEYILASLQGVDLVMKAAREAAEEVGRGCFGNHSHMQY